MRAILGMAVAGIAAATFATGASAVVTPPELIVDGGFEASGFGGTSTFYNIGRDHTTPAGFGWTASNVDIVANGGVAPYLANGGAYVLDLVGYGTRGYISQTVATDIGALYTLSFEYAKQPKIVDPTLLVELDGTTFGTLIGTAEWQTFSQTFVATKTSYTIFLKSTGSHNSGVYVDNISFVDPPAAVPEPATWSMMVGGFALAGIATRSRRRRLSTTV